MAVESTGSASTGGAAASTETSAKPVSGTANSLLTSDVTPSWSDSRLQDFLQRRDALLENERSVRSDAHFRSGLSVAAKAACTIVDRVRRKEHATLWTNEFEDSLAERRGDIYPGMMFSLAKDRMERSTLWKIVRGMPKGTLLHCHLEAMVDLPWLLDEIFQTESAQISASAPLNTPEARLGTDFTVQFVHPNRAQKNSFNIWDSSYEPGALVSLHTMAGAFPDGGKEGFLAWITSRCTITPDEALNHHHGPNDIWRKFISCFPILSSIINYEPIFRKFMFKMCQDLRRDGVSWVDMRTVFSRPFYRTDSEEPEPDFDLKLTVMEEEIKRASTAEPDLKMSDELWTGEGRTPTRTMPPFWGARLIWTSVRAFKTEDIINDMKMCIAMKLKHPDLIAGYDLVGQEDLGRPLKDLLPELFWFMDACKEAGVHIPFYFHAGETLGDGDETDNNLHTAIMLGTRRIGHGFSLYKHPTLVDAVKEKRILIESCPVSNEVLRLTSSIMSHPLPALLARGVAVSLCNDDPSILGQGVNGMSHDFWQALQGWENLGLSGLGSLAQNSVRWANFEDRTDDGWLQDIEKGAVGDDIKAQRLKQWNHEWEMFCLRVVDQYGGDLWDEVIKDPQTKALLNL